MLSKQDLRRVIAKEPSEVIQFVPKGPKQSYDVEPRKLPSGRWKGRVTYYDPDTGKRRETTRTFATRREANEWSREQEMAYRQDPNRKT